MALLKKDKGHVDKINATLETAVAVKAAHDKSASDPDHVYWVEMAWQGRDRQCWRWDGWLLGARAIAIVWIEGRGHSVRDIIQDRPIGDYTTLAEAQEEAMLAATDLPLAVCDFSAEMARFASMLHEAKAARDAQRRQASSLAIAAAHPAISTFNEKFSATARQRTSRSHARRADRRCARRQASERAIAAARRSLQDFRAKFRAAVGQDDLSSPMAACQ